MDFLNSDYFSINKKLMNITGLWPYQSQYIKFLKRGFFISYMAIACIPQLMAVKAYIINYDQILLLRFFCTFIIINGVNLKFITCISSNKKIQKVYENIDHNWKMITDQKERIMLEKISKFGSFLAKLYAVYMLLAGVGYTAIPFFPIIMDVVFPLKNGSRERIFIIDGVFPFDKYEHYTEMYFYESGISYAMIFIYLSVDTTYIVTMYQCIGLLDIVKYRIAESTRIENRNQQILKMDLLYSKIHRQNPINKTDIVYQKLIMAVKLHIDVLQLSLHNFVDNLEQAFNHGFFLVIGHCLIWYSAGLVVLFGTLDNKLEVFRMTSLYIGMTMHIFFLCYPAQVLTDSSNDLFLKTYNNEWYDCSIKVQKLLLIFMLKCRTPMGLTAGGIVPMNVETFGSFMKATFSYTTILSQMTEAEELHHQSDNT